MKPYGVTIQMKAIKQYFHVALFWKIKFKIFPSCSFKLTLLGVKGLKTVKK